MGDNRQGRKQSHLEATKRACRELIQAGIYPSLEVVNAIPRIYVNKNTLREVKRVLVTEEGLVLPHRSATADSPKPESKRRIPPEPGSVEEARMLLRKAERSVFGKQRTTAVLTKS